jgi:hypothetical protein
MTTLLVLAASIQIVSSAPPLSPEQAAAVLRTCQCLSNLTNAPSEPAKPAAPNSVVIPSDPRFGPFGVLHLSPPRPDLYIGPWPVMGPWPIVPSAVVPQAPMSPLHHPDDTVPQGHHAVH